MRIFALALVLVLAGCSTTAVPTGDKIARAPADPAKATIYIFNATTAIVSETAPLYVEEEKIGGLPLRAYTWFQCTPGTYKVAVGDTLIKHRMHAETQISVHAGDTIYLKYALHPEPDQLVSVGGLLADLVAGKQVTEPDLLIKLPPNEAEKLLQKYRLVGNTFTQPAG
jgi:hypothetical protein